MHWEGLDPKSILLELQKRGMIGAVPGKMITEKRIIEMIAEMEGLSG